MKKITIDYQNFKNLIKAVKPAISKDDPRPVLKFIKFEVDKSQIRAISCDGYMLQVATLEHGQIVDESFEFLLEPIKQFLDSTTLPYSTIEIECEENLKTKLTIQSYFTQTIVLTTPSGKDYLNWENVFPEVSEDLKITFSASRLIQLLKTCLNNQGYVTFKFCKSDKGIDNVKATLISHIDENIKKEYVLLPVRHF